jgi:FixJ family two-component response regulator
MSGLAFRGSLRKGIALPIIFITGHGDAPMTVRAMKTARWSSSQTFDDRVLLDAINGAIDRPGGGGTQRNWPG